MTKFKKTLAVIATAAACLIPLGCNLTNEQVDVIARNSGLASAVSWIALENPNQDEIKVVRSVLVLVKDKVGSVGSGQTYLVAFQKDIADFIESDQVEPRYKPVAYAGSFTILNSVDILFAMHPEWKEKEFRAISVVKEFTSGALQGLSLVEDDPVMQQARQLHVEIMKIELAPSVESP